MVCNLDSVHAKNNLYWGKKDEQKIIMDPNAIVRDSGKFSSQLMAIVFSIKWKSLRIAEYDLVEHLCDE